MTFTQRLRDMVDRECDGNTKEAARRAGLSYTTVRDLYTGKNKSPLAATLERLAQGLGVSADYLLGRSDEAPPARPPVVALSAASEGSGADLVRSLSHPVVVGSMPPRERVRRAFEFMLQEGGAHAFPARERALVYSWAETLLEGEGPGVE